MNQLLGRAWREKKPRTTQEELEVVESRKADDITFGTKHEGECTMYYIYHTSGKEGKDLRVGFGRYNRLSLALAP
jgi:hypothetical protein